MFANHISDILRQSLQKAQEAHDISHFTLYDTKHQHRGCAVPVSPKLAKSLNETLCRRMVWSEHVNVILSLKSKKTSSKQSKVPSWPFSESLKGCAAPRKGFRGYESTI